MASKNASRRLAAVALLALAGPAAAGAQDAYVVQPGDTLTAIADRFGTTVQALATENRLDAGGLLIAGTRLRLAYTLLPATRYTVRPGDNLTAVALRLGTTVEALTAANRISRPDLLVEGTRLLIPARVRGGGDPAPASSATSIRAALDHWAAHYGVDARLVRAVAWMESGYQDHVVSPEGAHGVMQVLPVTWRYVETVLLGRRVERTVEGNIRVGVLYLRQLLREFRGDERLAVASYYQGPRAVREQGIFAATLAYVDAVLSLKQRV